MTAILAHYSEAHTTQHELQPQQQKVYEVIFTSASISAILSRMVGILSLPRCTAHKRRFLQLQFSRAYLARDLNRDLLQPKMVQFSYQFVWFRAAHCTF